MTSTVTMHIGDVRDTLERLKAQGATFDHVVTSPPFLALRSYLPADHPDKHREIGSEPTPAAFLDTLYGLTAQLGELVPEWGSVCVELGDTMSGSGSPGGDYNADGMRAGQPRTTYAGARAAVGGEWPLAKSMVGIPWSYTLGLIWGRNPVTGTESPAGRWRIRNVICWARPNPPVGSLGKRNPTARTGDYKFRPATSYITVACRGTGRFFDLDAVRTEHKQPDGWQRTGGVKYQGAQDDHHVGPRFAVNVGNPAGAPPLDWHTDHLDGDWLWKLATAPYPGSHYATYPLTLPRRLIQAMCPQRVCRECGWPSERITGANTLDTYRTSSRPQTRKAVALADAHGLTDAHIAAIRAFGTSDTGKATTLNNGAGANTDEVKRLAGEAKAVLGGYFREFVMSTNSTPASTWTDCGHNAWRPGTVLDPFGGSGTTAVAAALEQRDATLIDIDRRNIDLVDERLRRELRVLNRTEHGDTITWTVDTVTAVELAADRAGQTTLFGDTTA